MIVARKGRKKEGKEGDMQSYDMYECIA